MKSTMQYLPLWMREGITGGLVVVRGVTVTPSRGFTIATQWGIK
jgi:hypothetical protein